MKFKSFLKIGLPIIGISALSVTLPLALTSCSDSKSNNETNKNINLDSNSVKNVESALDNISIQNDAASQDDVTNTILNTLGVVSEQLAAIDYQKNNVNSLDLENTKTEWVVKITLNDGYEWNASENSDFAIENNTLFFKVETDFEQVIIKTNEIFNEEKIEKSINQIHNSSDLKDSKLLNEVISKNDKRIIPSSFSVKLSTGDSLKNTVNEVQTQSNILVNIKPDINNGFIFDSSEVNKTITYKYLNFDNSNLINSISKELASYITNFNNNELINSGTIKDITLDDGSKIQYELSTFDARYQQTILDIRNGFGTQVYNLKFDLNSLNFNIQNVKEQLQTELANEILKNSEFTVNKDSPYLKDDNLINLQYNEIDNSITVQLRSMILNTDLDDLNQLIEVAKTVTADTLNRNSRSNATNRKKSFVVKTILGIADLSDTALENITSNADNEQNSITITIPKKYGFFSKQFIESVNNKVISGINVDIQVDDNNTTLKLTNVNFGKEVEIPQKTTADKINGFINDIYTKIEFDNLEDYQKYINTPNQKNTTIEVITNSKLWNQISEYINIPSDNIWTIILDKITNSDNQVKFNLTITLKSGYIFGDSSNSDLNNIQQNKWNPTSNSEDENLKENIENTKVSFGTYIIGWDILKFENIVLK